MNDQSEDIRKRLHEILGQFVEEERLFEERCRQAEADDRTLAKEHAYAVHKLGNRGDHAMIRSAHEAMFKVHRKIRNKHKELIRHALAVSSQMDSGQMSEREILWELKQSQEALVQMKLEHQVIEQERRKILQDHRTIVARLGFDR
ncbi:MAG: hypothetical protein P1R58_07245 [bacterium]|nr:hypothetical protein [bacterium]